MGAGRRTKTTVRHHFAPTRTVIIKKKIIISVGKDVEKMEPLYTAGRNVKMSNGTAAVQKSLAVPPKLNLELPYEPVIPLLVYTQEN